MRNADHALASAMSTTSAAALVMLAIAANVGAWCLVFAVVLFILLCGSAIIRYRDEACTDV